MAKRLSGAAYRQYLEFAAGHSTDWLLSSQSMRRYLRYRLYLVDAQIERVLSDLQQYDTPPLPEDLGDETFPEEVWASWASLNYLTRARDELHEALARSKPTVN